MDEQDKDPMRYANYLIEPKEEILDDLEFAEERESGKDFSIPREELSKTCLHLENTDSDQQIVKLKPVEIGTILGKVKEVFQNTPKTSENKEVSAGHNMSTHIKREPFQTDANLTADNSEILGAPPRKKLMTKKNKGVHQTTVIEKNTEFALNKGEPGIQDVCSNTEIIKPANEEVINADVNVKQNAITPININDSDDQSSRDSYTTDIIQYHDTVVCGSEGDQQNASKFNDCITEKPSGANGSRSNGRKKLQSHNRVCSSEGDQPNASKSSDCITDKPSGANGSRSNGRKKLQSRNRVCSSEGDQPNASKSNDCITEKPSGANGSRGNKRKKLFDCDLCQATFTFKARLVRHMWTHSGEKPFHCNFCEKKFSRKHHLIAHTRQCHTGDMPNACQHCHYKTVDKKTLKYHTMTHTGERPFSCQVCDKKFTKKFNMTIHMRTHTGEKPYYCKHCSYKCSYPSYMKAHMRTHTGEKPYSCKQCQRKFSDKRSVKTHMRVHTGERFYCDLCHLNYIKKSHLILHIKRKHTNEKF